MCSNSCRFFIGLLNLPREWVFFIADLMWCVTVFEYDILDSFGNLIEEKWTFYGFNQLENNKIEVCKEMWWNWDMMLGWSLVWSVVWCFNVVEIRSFSAEGLKKWTKHGLKYLLASPPITPFIPPSTRPSPPFALHNMRTYPIFLQSSLKTAQFYDIYPSSSTNKTT